METCAKYNIPCARAASAHHITLLNTLCLIKIFQNLNLVDLITVSQVHPMFMDIIREHIIGQRLFDCDKISKYFPAEQMLETFGASMRELKLSADSFEPKIPSRKIMSPNDIAFKVLARCCTNLRKLSIKLSMYYESWSPAVLQRAALFLSNLESIEFQKVSLSSYQILQYVLNLCPNLQEIKIKVRIYLWPLQKFTKLTSLEVTYPCKYRLKQSLENNPQIRELIVTTFCSSNILLLLALPQLQCLKLFNLFVREDFIDSLVLLAQKNTIVDLTLHWRANKPDEALVNYKETEKRQKIKRAMAAFTSLKKINLSASNNKQCVLVSDILTSLPSVVACTIGGEFHQNTVLSLVTEKLEILRIEPDIQLTITRIFYQKLLLAKLTLKNNCLRLFAPESCIGDLSDVYQPGELKIISF